MVRDSFARQRDGFLACARVLRPGRTLTVCMADVYAVTGEERVAIATMLSTIIIRPGSGPGAS